MIGGGGKSKRRNTAIIQQQINVRSGPGTSFNSLGTLNPQDVVTLTGKDANGAWLQIDFAAGPEGKGWVNAAFVQASGVETLPIVTEGNVIVGTGTPTTAPPHAAPTVIPALADGDSAVAPAVNVALTAPGTRSFQYSSDVSSPEATRRIGSSSPRLHKISRSSWSVRGAIRMWLNYCRTISSAESSCAGKSF